MLCIHDESSERHGDSVCSNDLGYGCTVLSFNLTWELGTSAQQASQALGLSVVSRVQGRVCFMPFNKPEQNIRADVLGMSSNMCLLTCVQLKMVNMLLLSHA